MTFALTDSLFPSNNHISCERSDLLCETNGKTYLISLAKRLISGLKIIPDCEDFPTLKKGSRVEPQTLVGWKGPTAII